MKQNVTKLLTQLNPTLKIQQNYYKKFPKNYSNLVNKLKRKHSSDAIDESRAGTDVAADEAIPLPYKTPPPASPDVIVTGSGIVKSIKRSIPAN